MFQHCMRKLFTLLLSTTWLLGLSLLQMLRNSFQVSLIFKRKLDFLDLFCIFIIKLMFHKKIVWILLFKYITDQGNSGFSNSVSGRLPRSPRSGQHFGPSQPQTASVKSWNDRVSFPWPENSKYWGSVLALFLWTLGPWGWISVSQFQ